MPTGYIKLRRGILEHLREHRLTVPEYVVYTVLLMLADYSTGIWEGSARFLAREIGAPERWCQRALLGLRSKGYVSCTPTKRPYQITVVKYHPYATPETQACDTRDAYNANHATPETHKADRIYLKKEKNKERSKEVKILRNGGAMSAPGFGAFWEVYPKRVGKLPAQKAWAKIPGIEGHVLEVVQAVEAWKKTEQWTDAQFIPYPATFLNQRRWQDEIPLPGGTKSERRIRHNLTAIERVAEHYAQVDRSAGRTLSAGTNGTGDHDLLRLSPTRGPQRS